MIKCPICNIPYTENIPIICRWCGTNILNKIKELEQKEKNKNHLYNWIKKNEERIEKEKNEQLKIEQKIKEKAFSKLKCRYCNSNNLKIIELINSSNIHIKCNECEKWGTRKYYNKSTGKFGNLIKCDWCGSLSTEVSSQTGFPEWHYTDFQHIKNIMLCSICDYNHYEELQEKDEKIHYNKHLIIEYYFDGDDLKYWKEGDEGVDFKEIEVNNDDGRQRYTKAIKKMKNEFPKSTKFIDKEES